MIRRAEPSDAAAIAGFLSRQIETSMFLLGNLESHGIGERLHPNGTHFLLRICESKITGVFGWTNGGYVMPQLPGLTPAEAKGCAEALHGFTLRGITGPPDQVALILAAVPIAPDRWALNRDEPLMSRDLKDLPAVNAQLRSPVTADRGLLERWFAAYSAETGLSRGAASRIMAVARAHAAIGSDTVRLMIRDDVPIAMSGINARAGAVVQIGGVFVSPEHRGRGLAGALVVGHLVELRDKGIGRAILFAASSTAERAYARIGFSRIGSYRVAVLARPVMLGAAA